MRDRSENKNQGGREKFSLNSRRNILKRMSTFIVVRRKKDCPKLAKERRSKAQSQALHMVKMEIQILF